MVEDGLHVRDIVGGPDPQLLAGVFEALCLNVAHLIDRVVALLSPLQLLVQEI